MSIGGPIIYFMPKRVGRSESNHKIGYFSGREIEKEHFPGLCGMHLQKCFGAKPQDPFSYLCDTIKGNGSIAAKVKGMVIKTLCLETQNPFIFLSF